MSQPGHLNPPAAQVAVNATVSGVSRGAASQLDAGSLLPASEWGPLSRVIGGPLGRHARVGGVWFDPMPWALVLAALNWVLLMWRQVPCQQVTAGEPVNAFLRGCYSDIPLFYQGNGIATGAGIFSAAGSAVPALVGYLAGFNRWLIGHLGANTSASASAQNQLEASYMFFVLCAIGLFGCFIALVWAHLQMGRDSASESTGWVRVRSFDALLIAASPVVLASGLISWQLLPVALASLALLAWARKHTVVSGVLFGFAASAGAYPILVMLAIGMLALRAAKGRDAAEMLITTLGVWLVVNLPAFIAAPGGWLNYWLDVLGSGAGMGSIWFAAVRMGVDSSLVGVVATVFVTAAIVAVLWLAITVPSRPRIGQVAFLLVACVLVLGPQYSPQWALFLLPLVVLALPKVADWAVWTIAELAYWLATWGYLEGIIGAGSGAEVLYWLAMLGRMGAIVWIALSVINDMTHPWFDPVRQAFVDDPVGGVLDHAIDAGWAGQSSAKAHAS